MKAGDRNLAGVRDESLQITSVLGNLPISCFGLRHVDHYPYVPRQLLLRLVA